MNIGAFWSNTGSFSLLSKTELKIGEIRKKEEEGWRKVEERSVKESVKTKKYCKTPTQTTQTEN